MSKEKNEIDILNEKYKNQFVAVSNSFLRGREKTNLLEGKIEVLAIHHMDKDTKMREKTDPNGQSYSVKYVVLSASEIKQLMGREDGNTYTDIRKAAIALKQKIIILEDRDSKQFVLKSIYGDVAYDDGKLMVEFNPDMESYFTNLKENFTKLSLPIMFSFKKNGGFQLYKILKSMAYSPNLPAIDMSLSQEDLPVFYKEYGLTELRMLLGYVDLSQPKLKEEGSKKRPNFEKMEKEEKKPMYKRWNDFYSKVIVPGVEEINKISDIYIHEVKVERSGKGGKVVGVTFVIQHNKAYYADHNDYSFDNMGSNKKKKDVLSEDAIDEILEEMHSMFDLKIKEYRELAVEAEYDLELIRWAYNKYIDSGETGDLFETLLSYIKYDTAEDEAEKLTQEEKDSFVDWLADMIDVRLKLKDYKAISEKSGFDKERAQMAIDAYNAYEGEIANVAGFLIKALEQGWKKSAGRGPRSKKNMFNNFEQRENDWDSIAEDLMKNQKPIG